MIKQIVDFSRDGDGRAAVIEVFMLVEDPQVHIEAIKTLAEDGAIIQSADADTIRAVYEDRRRKPTIFSRGMNPYTPRKPYISYKHITF